MRNQLNISNGYESNGTGTFAGLYSSNGPTGTGACGTASAPAACAAGDANLDFLTGSESAFEQSKQQQNALRAPIPSVYLQDTYHPAPRLTLVAGVRWQPEYYPHDFFNRGTTFDYAGFLANKTSSVYPNAPAGTFFYGDPGVSRAYTANSIWQFSPNVGLSLDPFANGKTVLRAGFELAYDEVNFFNAQRNEQNPPYATAARPNTSNQICFSHPWLTGGSGAGCAQTGGADTSPFPTPQLPTPATAVFPAQSQYVVLPQQFHASDTAQWTASVQQSFSHGWQLQLDYIGNHTAHAPMGLPLSNAVYIPGVWGANGTGCDPIAKTGPASVFVLRPAKEYAANQQCSTTSDSQSRYALTIANPAQGNAYSGGGSGSTQVVSYGWASYNGLVTTVQHRLSSTFSLLANHTWAKCLNINDAAGDYAGSSVSNPFNLRQDYGPCGSDYRHIENIVMVLKSDFAFDHRLEKLLVNNWEFAPLVHIQSGAPFNVTQGADQSLTANGNDRPNLVPGQPIYLKYAILSASSQASAAISIRPRSPSTRFRARLGTLAETHSMAVRPTRWMRRSRVSSRCTSGLRSTFGWRRSTCSTTPISATPARATLHRATLPLGRFRAQAIAHGSSRRRLRSRFSSQREQTRPASTEAGRFVSSGFPRCT